MKDMGASPVATGLAGAVAPEPPSRLGPSDGIPSAAVWRLFYADKSERLCVRYDLASRWKTDVNVRQYDSDDNDLHIDLADVRWLAARLLDAASGIEAATAGETTKIGSTEGESPAPKGDAQGEPS